jgi:hypothetical protein
MDVEPHKRVEFFHEVVQMSPTLGKQDTQDLLDYLLALLRSSPVLLLRL